MTALSCKYHWSTVRRLSHLSLPGVVSRRLMMFFISRATQRKNLRNLSVRGIVKNNICRTRDTRRTLARPAPLRRIEHRSPIRSVPLLDASETRERSHAILFSKVDGTREQAKWYRSKSSRAIRSLVHTYLLCNHRSPIDPFGGHRVARRSLYLTHTRELRPLPLPRSIT